MTDRRDHAEAIPRVVESVAEHAVESRPVAAMAEITQVSNDDRRVTIELLSDQGAKSSNVPVAVPFADGDSGDVLPIEPGIKGIALFLDHPVEEQLSSSEGHDSDSTGMDIEDAIFLPACITTDEEQWPSHVSGDRVWEHPSGSRIEMDKDGGVRFIHENGGTVEVGGVVDEGDERRPDNLHGNSVHPDDAIAGTEAQHHGPNPYEDNETWPVGNGGETYDQMSHPEGSHVTITHRGVSLGGSEESDTDAVVSGQNNDPERSELDGRHQHFHVKHNADGTADLIGPQLSFREFIAWMTDSNRQSTLNNADQYAEARTYAENYLAWLEDQVGRTLDPTNPADWPDEEPMPTPEEREQFEP